ncbi:MAG: leucine-rich repeat protein [Clostridiales bacterium]|nr:leucine-rich repeat protein [Clostridiales bacterium]
MIRRILTSAAVAAAILVNTMGVPAVADTINYASVNINNCEAADYTSFSFVCKDGDPITLSLSGGSLNLQSTCATSIEMLVKNLGTGNIVAHKNTMEHSFSLDVNTNTEASAVYYVDLTYTAEGVRYQFQDIYLMKQSNGNLVFVKSPVYDFNVERCSEMWTDDVSLQECLQPQNDVECDDPYVIKMSNEICAGCTTDWEKTYAIYTYIISEFAYDDVQIEDTSYSYQDDAVSLLRRKIAICEGMGNTFTALCRAQGVPAVVEFGVSENFSDFVNLSAKRDNEWPNHAWAAVCLDGTWYFVDPTFDNSSHYSGTAYNSGSVEHGRHYYNYYLLPLEIFSMDHKICDADTVHGIESTGLCGDHATYSISRDGTITISGSGEIILPSGVNGFSKVVFEEGSNITSIGRRCFIDCDLITQVILPDTVTRIEDEAFNTCEDLEYIYLPEGLTFIGQEAFDICDELAYVYVPDSVEEMSVYAFDDCPRLIISVPAHLEGFEAENYVQPHRIIVRDQ